MPMFSNGVFQKFLQGQAALQPTLWHFDPRLEFLALLDPRLLIDPLMGQDAPGQVFACLCCFAALEVRQGDVQITPIA